MHLDRIQLDGLFVEVRPEIRELELDFRESLLKRARAFARVHEPLLIIGIRLLLYSERFIIAALKHAASIAGRFYVIRQTVHSCGNKARE